MEKPNIFSCMLYKWTISGLNNDQISIVYGFAYIDNLQPFLCFASKENLTNVVCMQYYCWHNLTRQSVVLVIADDTNNNEKNMNLSLF